MARGFRLDEHASAAGLRTRPGRRLHPRRERLFPGMDTRAREGAVRVEDRHQVDAPRAEVLHHRGGPDLDARRRHARRPLRHPLRPAGLQAERGVAAGRAPALEAAYGATSLAALGDDRSPARRTTGRGATRSADAGHAVPATRHDERGRARRAQQPRQSGRAVLGLGRRGLDEGRGSSFERTRSAGDPNVVALGEDGRLDRRREGREDASGPFQPGAGHGHLADVVGGRALLSVARMRLAADPDQAEGVERGEDCRARSHHHVVAAGLDVEPCSVARAFVPAREEHRAIPERVEHRTRRRGQRFRLRDEHKPLSARRGASAHRFDADERLVVGQRPQPRDAPRLEQPLRLAVPREHT